MPRPDCPRCGSDLVVAAPSGAPSVLVMELRGETVPRPESDRFEWLCRSCGHRWEPVEGATADLDGEPAEPTAPEAEPTATAAPERPSLGLTLMRARHAAGATLAEASRATGVWERYLQALETDAPPEEFPSHGYARLYLREYARYLRLDPDRLLRELDELHPVEGEPVLEAIPDERRRRGGRGLAVALAVVSAIALLAIAIRQPGSSPAPPLLPRAAGPTAAAGGATEEDAAGAPASPAPPPPSGIRATLSIGQASWVQAVADGEVVAAATLEPGTRVSYRAERTLELTLGNAGGVHLRVNREPVPTGTPGEVVTLSFRWRHGTVSLERT